MRAAVVVNPTKVGRPAAAQARVNGLAAALGEPPPMWLETTPDDPGPGQARRAMAGGAEMVMVWGGDGTVNGVVDALKYSGVPVGLLSGGTANLLARNLGVPLDLSGAVTTAYRGADRVIDLLGVDLGSGEHRISMIMCGAGFDAAMMAAPESMKKRLGWGAYVVAGASELRRPPMKIRLSIDGGPIEKLRGHTVLVANLGLLVAGLDLLPDAQPDDGQLEVLVIDPTTPVDWLRTTASILLSRGSDADPSQLSYRGGDAAVRLGHVRKRQIDGDLVSSGSGFDVQVLPGAATLRVPAARRENAVSASGGAP